MRVPVRRPQPGWTEGQGLRGWGEASGGRCRARPHPRFPSGPGLARYGQRPRPSVTWAMVSGLSPGARGFGLDVDETPVPHSGTRSPRETAAQQALSPSSLISVTPACFLANS